MDKKNNFNQTLPVISKLLKEIIPNKTVGIGNLAKGFLKDESDKIAEPITSFHKLSLFSDTGKIAKLKPLYKKRNQIYSLKTICLYICYH